MIESSYGLDQLVLAVLFEALAEEELESGDTRLVFKEKDRSDNVKLGTMIYIYGV